MKIFSVLIFSLFISTTSYNQAPGLVIQTGISTAYSKDKIITSTGQAHYGWMVGADARLLDGDLYFIIGAHYHQTSLESSSSPDFFGKNDWSILMGRCGIGFNLFRLSEKLSFRSKLLGSVNFLVDAPVDALNIPNYLELNDSFLGAVTGLGVTLGSFDFDLEYQYGLINSYKLQPKSTFDSWTLMAGFHF